MAQLHDPRTTYETTFRFQHYDGGDWQWVADTEVEEANGYAVLAAFAAAQARNCRLIRDIFGNPFRLAAIDPSLLSWEGGIVVKLAQGIYDDLAFDRLPVLADALEDAGCDDAHFLSHLRSDGPHVRGCWALDLCLDKC